VTEILQGGFYFHPTDEELSLDPKKQRSLLGGPGSVGTPERKKPLGRIKFPYRNSESAVVVQAAMAGVGRRRFRAAMARRTRRRIVLSRVRWLAKTPWRARRDGGMRDLQDLAHHEDGSK
jgi:hypothetical protein